MASSFLGEEALEFYRVFAALAEGGQVQMPLARTFWSPRFGMLADRFGVGWMVNVMSYVGRRQRLAESRRGDRQACR